MEFYIDGGDLIFHDGYPLKPAQIVAHVLKSKHFFVNNLEVPRMFT